MLETSTNGAGAGGDGAAAGREDQRGVAEPGFVAGARVAAAGAPVRAGVPDPELVEQAKRRTFTAKYKLGILAKAEACTRWRCTAASAVASWAFSRYWTVQATM